MRGRAVEKEDLDTEEISLQVCFFVFFMSNAV